MVSGKLSVTGNPDLNQSDLLVGTATSCGGSGPVIGRGTGLKASPLPSHCETFGFRDEDPRGRVVLLVRLGQIDSRVRVYLQGDLDTKGRSHKVLLT